MLRYLGIPVPAGTSFPMMTFSFSPMSSSHLPFIAASVSTLVVSWNDAADRKLSVCSDALVIPRSAGLHVAGFSPFSSASALVSSNLKDVDQFPGEQIRISRILHLHLAHHLSDYYLNMLVIYLNTL